MDFPEPTPDIKTAVSDLVGRSGATSMGFGPHDPDVPAGALRWWAEANYPTGQLRIEDHETVDGALEALAVKLLTDAQCQRCGGTVALAREGSWDYLNEDEHIWVQGDFERDPCRWERIGDRWQHGCVLMPAGDDEIHSAEKLARALEELDDPKLKEVIWMARRGYYHDFLSPWADNIPRLAQTLRRAGLQDLVQRVIDGEFDATYAEAEWWASKPEAQEAIDMVLPSGEVVPPKPREPQSQDWWSAQRKRKR